MKLPEVHFSGVEVGLDGLHGGLGAPRHPESFLLTLHEAWVGKASCEEVTSDGQKLHVSGDLSVVADERNVAREFQKIGCNIFWVAN